MHSLAAVAFRALLVALLKVTIPQYLSTYLSDKNLASQVRFRALNSAAWQLLLSFSKKFLSRLLPFAGVFSRLHGAGFVCRLALHAQALWRSLSQTKLLFRAGRARA